jgi:hypothetical protein
MPESPYMVPLYVARVADLHVGSFVAVTCKHWGHLAELPVVLLRERLPRHSFVKHLGPQFRCRECHHKGAEVDARGAGALEVTAGRSRHQRGVGGIFNWCGLTACQQAKPALGPMSGIIRPCFKAVSDCVALPPT